MTLIYNPMAQLLDTPKDIRHILLNIPRDPNPIPKLFHDLTNPFNPQRGSKLIISLPIRMFMLMIMINLSKILNFHLSIFFIGI
jgi:hypothetical protein